MEHLRRCKVQQSIDLIEVATNHAVQYQLHHATETPPLWVPCRVAARVCNQTHEQARSSTICKQLTYRCPVRESNAPIRLTALKIATAVSNSGTMGKYTIHIMS